MRLFVALSPPPDTLDAVEAAVALGRAHTPDLRWVPREEWHITLVFLGEVAEERLPALAERVAEQVRVRHPLTLGVQGWGRFPRRGPRSAVLWAAVTGDTVALDRLARGLRSAARAARIPVERRPYVPHVTIARSRPPRDLSDTVAALGTLSGTVWEARRVHLVESRPGAADRYRTVRTWELG
ncbi:RNA 2',3'-cyclic phosphodiesterase [Nocardiopsis sp. CNT312]|uniref:RNA 2',3'-cyclic phosphodiesterase n=1 Tax=Nocardiopsis sp. CNT312 TaxID=1137268 RepID=UPI00048B5559|nr:RNA 2',3'-cyclic phosphodiesterase [Nocardiopsis sp. CNT312]